jgi:hypothetical protein
MSTQAFFFFLFSFYFFQGLSQLRCRCHVYVLSCFQALGKRGEDTELQEELTCNCKRYIEIRCIAIRLDPLQHILLKSAGYADVSIAC